jgi:hypothetical protein
MDLSIATEEDRKKWDTQITDSYGGTIFHTLKYLRCLESHSSKSLFQSQEKGRLIPIVAREGAEIIALVPLFIYTSHGIRIVRSGNDRQDTMYLGPVFLQDYALKPSKLQIRALRLQKELDVFIKNRLKAQMVHLIVSPFYPDARPYTWSGYDVQPLHTYFIDLGKGPDLIWSDLNRGVRNMISKARKNQIRIENGSIEDAERIYDLLRTRTRTNSPKNLILDVVRTLSPDNCRIFTAKQDNELLSGVIVLHYGRYAHLWVGFPGSDTQNLGANELLMMEAITWAHSEGYHILELVGGDDISTFNFKRKFNAALKPYFKTNGSSRFLRTYKYAKQLIMRSDIDLDDFTCD